MPAYILISLSKSHILKKKNESLDNKIEDTCRIIKKAIDQNVQSTLQNLEDDALILIASISEKIEQYK